MGRQVFVKNYNNLSGGVITDLNKLAGAPENAVKDALNFEFTASDGANRRKALDLESGIAGSDYTQLNSDLSLGTAKQQVFTFKGILDALDAPTHNIVLNTFEGKGIVYDLGSDQQLADAVADSAVSTTEVDPNAGDWRGIAWSPDLGMFAAVAYSTADPIMISPDGVHWSPVRTLPSGFDEFNGITWSPELGQFVAISWTGDYSVAVSTNGFDWDTYQFSSGIFSSELYDISWAAEINTYVAVGFDATITPGFIAYSTDGINWADASGYSPLRAWKGVTWSPELELFVAVASSDYLVSNGRAATSPDGITWTARSVPTDRSWYAVTWSPTLAKYYAVAHGSDYIMSSADGITWAESQDGADTGNWERIIWVPELALLVAVASTGTNRCQTSTDGSTWTARTIEASDWESVVWSVELGKLLAVADAGTNRTSWSDDGITWSVPSDSALDDNSQDWAEVQGIPVGSVGLDRLYTLYNTDATTYQFTTTFGLGKEPAVRDFTGVSDGLDIDERPNVMVFTAGSITGTFQEDEEILITSGTDKRRFRIVDLRSVSVWGVDKSLIGSSTTAFDGGDTTDYYNYTVVGVTSAATATITATSGAGLSDAHRYNLLNQGWTQTHMDTYAKTIEKWPSNSQTWYSGRDSSNDFSPTELDKIAFGNSEAPKGHIILNPFKEWRHTKVPGVWSGSVSTITYDRGFTTLASFGSRIALSGVSINGSDNTVYISPVIFNKIVTADNAAIDDLDFSEIFKFHQSNDPTADIGNELLPDDGVVIPITAAKRIFKVVELQNAVLVFASNGVWAISGLDAQSGFTTDAFSVIKVSGAPGTTNARSIVATSESVYYMAPDGIYAINYSPEGAFVAVNITINRIGAIYKGITPAVREAVISYYDEDNQKIYWAYNGESTATYPEIRNKLLVLNLAINAFYPLKTPQTLVDAGVQLGTLHMSINGFTQDTAFPNSDGTIPLKVFVTEVDDTTATNFKHSVMEFNNSGALEFSDYDLWRTDVHSDSSGTVDEDAYIETWDDTLGDTTRSKQAIWVFAHMTKTEYGFEDLGGGALSALGQSSFQMQSRWDWNVSASGGKWGTAREIYRHSRLYVPADVNDVYDSGESVITTKNKIYGRGRALSLRFDAVANKDAILLGYSIPYSVEGTP